MREKPLCCAVALLLLTGCGITSLTKSTTRITEKAINAQGEMVPTSIIVVESRPDAHVKIERNQKGYKAEVDNRGRPGFVESMAERALDRTEIIVGSGERKNGD